LYEAKLGEISRFKEWGKRREGNNSQRTTSIAFFFSGVFCEVRRGPSEPKQRGKRGEEILAKVIMA